MAISIRLKRMGSNHKPFFRLVVADGRRATRGKVFERVGTYNPLANGDQIQVDTARVEEWISRGAHVTPAVARLLIRAAGLNK